MRRIEKNRKGFTLAEEVVTVLLIGILVASASAILLNAMRIFCQNVNKIKIHVPVGTQVKVLSNTSEINIVKIFYT